MSHFHWTLIAAILGSSMAFADGTIVNVALPAIQADLGADASQAQWVIESYALFLASLLLVGGALGDRFGRRRIFMLGVAVFTVSAIPSLRAFAQSCSPAPHWRCSARWPRGC
jgi:MFS family permease